MESRWDCIVVGGGAAGLSAALVLGRARKRTLVVDAGGQSNLTAHGIGGLLGHNGLPPAELYAAGRRELAEFPNVEVRTGQVVRAKPEGDDLVLELADGSVEGTRRVLLATGMDYRYPDVPGIEERWGGSVFHCPFCHGWEVRDRKIGVLDPSDSPAEKALLIRGWSDDVTLYTHGPAEIEPADAERLADAGIDVDERPVTGLRGSGDGLDAVTFEDGEERACAALLVAVTLHQRSPLPEQLGVELADPTKLTADSIDVGTTHATSVDGVFAAGDNTSQMPSVASAIAAGSMAAAGIVASLM